VVNYELKFSKSVEKDFLKLESFLFKRIWSKLENLQQNPTPVGSLKITNSEFHRIRVGEYRIIYFINNAKKIIEVLRVKHRKDVYKDL
jgi:mRNA interferase RelE/StbE